MSQTEFDSGAGEDAHQRLMDMLLGFAVSQIIRTTVELSIADHLADGPLTANEVAGRENSAPDTTLRLMRGCVTIGLLTADSQGRFHGTPLLETLRSNAPRSLRETVLAVTNRAYWLPWTAFGASVRSGYSQAHNTLGMDFFDYLERNPALAQEFTALWALDLADTIDITTSGWPWTSEARTAHCWRGCRKPTPNCTGSSSDDEHCVKILRRCREAMEPNGRVAIVEMVVGDDSNPGRAALMDLGMLAVFKGRERSLPDFDKLLNRAGLRRTLVRTAGSPQSVIEAVAA